METCPHCGKVAKSVKYHIWRMHGDGQKHNPNAGYETGSRHAWNKGLTAETDSRVESNRKAIVVSKATQEVKGCFSWTREERSSAAKEQGFGGYQENAGRSKKFSVTDSFGKQTTLQSTFELRCSEILNELGIRWVRPKALKYDGRNYFADFYLTDYDIWLDPKNAYKAKQDEEKIRKVIEQNGVKLYVLLEHQLTKEFITGII